MWISYIFLMTCDFHVVIWEECFFLSCYFCSEDVFICEDGAAHPALSEFFQVSWGWQPTVCLCFSFQCHSAEQRKRSDKHRYDWIVCLVLAVCNYTRLLWVMFLQWVLKWATIWLVLNFLLFDVFLRECHQNHLLLINYLHCCCNKTANWTNFIIGLCFTSSFGI